MYYISDFLNLAEFIIQNIKQNLSEEAEHAGFREKAVLAHPITCLILQ